jgi:hypothetical protein
MKSEERLCKNCGVWEERAPELYCDTCHKAYEDGRKAGAKYGK